MKKFILFTVVLLFLAGCSSRKQIERSLYSGNYDQAINNALKKLETNKDKKRKQDFVVLLEDAYKKVVKRDLKTIEQLKKDGNPENYKTIYNLYTNLDARQEAVKAVMPLQINGKLVQFKFNNYTSEIVDTRAKVSQYMYEQALGLLESNDKYAVREAHSTLLYIERINANYKDIRQLMDQAHQKGTDFVIVTIENQTQQIIPVGLEEDLLDFDTYGLNDFWTVYHANDNNDVEYDYAMQLQLRQINISPERITEKQILREKEIVDGWEYVLDANGNVTQDSLGNDIKVDKIISIKARFFEVSQSKSAQVIGKVVYSDLRTNQILETFSIDSEFVFENFFGRFRGDRRALTAEDIELLNHRQIPYPSNSQMVFDTGEDLKYKLKQIINNHSFRS